ncbi:MAG: DUF2231 domain-containing protein, partial [Bacteroidales bacterium]|nr:DUF2231 domain-containing protein [Bacteroidales bacterium]
HPMLVHFPIALTLVGIVLELVRVVFCKTDAKLSSGELLLYMAAATAVFALLSGFLFTSTFSGKPLEVRNTHMLLAVLSTVALSLASLFYLLYRFGKQKKSIFSTIGLTFYVIAAILMGATGYMGGSLVYSYMIGL